MKKFTKILCCTLGLGFLLAGCATVGNIKNSNSELIYNGNSAVMVDGYLYYGNAYSKVDFETDADYKASAKISYLSRLNTNIELAAKSKDYSPKKVANVTTQVVAHNNSFMFVLGNYIYYTTPNRQKAIDSEDGASKHFFNYSTVMRSELNGDDVTKLYTTNGEVSSIEVVKYNDRYYIIMLAGEDLVKISLGKKVSASVIATGVKSVAVPETYQEKKAGSSLNWNGYIFYTTDKKSANGATDINGSSVNRVLVSGGETEEIDWRQGVSINFLGRNEDKVIYTMTGDETEVYLSNVALNGNSKNAFTNSRKLFYPATSIENIEAISTEAVDYGYIFTTNTNKLGYVDQRNDKYGIITLNFNNEPLTNYNKLFVAERTMYFSTSTGIFKANLSTAFTGNGGDINVDCERLVEMTAIYEGDLYAFDGTYIYYYAQLEAVETEEDEENATEETDDTYYMYRTRVSGNSSADAREPYQLLSLTKNVNRRS